MAVDTKGSKTTVQGDAKVVQVDYSNDESIKCTLTSMEVVITSVKYQFSFKVSHSFKVAAPEGFQKNIITNLNKYIKL